MSRLPGAFPERLAQRRPSLPWRRWSLDDRERLRLLRALREERDRAADRGDEAVAALLGAPVEGLEALVEGPPPPPPPRESDVARLVRLLREEGELRNGRRWLSRERLLALGFRADTLRFTAARARRAGVVVRAEAGGYALEEEPR